MTGAQKKTDAYEPMDSQKTREYKMTGAHKSHEYEVMDAQKKKTDANKLMDFSEN